MRCSFPGRTNLTRFPFHSDYASVGMKQESWALSDDYKKVVRPLFDKFFEKDVECESFLVLGGLRRLTRL